MSIFLGATINNEHTLRDWGAAITNSDIISLPAPNLTYLEVPGRNGRLDLSEALTGDVTYANRTIKLALASSVSIASWVERCSHIFNTCHGRMVKVIFDDDPGHYYQGRASVSTPQRVRNGGQFVLTVDADPFRYDVDLTTATFTGQDGTVTGSLQNARMPVCPTITVTAACELVVGGVTYSLLAGTRPIPALILMEGATPFTLTGADHITFSYRQGVL